MNKKTKTVRYTGIQPQYFPRLHYFARILNTDVYAIRDDAQYVRKHKYPNGSVGKSYQAHTPIKQSFGMQLISIPIVHDGFIPLASTKIESNADWVKTHLRTLQIAYANSLNFSVLYPEIEMFLGENYESLADLNIITTLWGILRVLGEERVTKDMLTISKVLEKLQENKSVRLKQIKKASESKALKNPNLKTNEKIVELCLEYGANVDYCGGTGVAAYVDHSLFKENGITIEVQDWKCREYPQLFSKRQGFIANLSIADLLFNTSSKEALSILLG